MKIYIPIWLDLLYTSAGDNRVVQPDLHSNMVRFIIVTFQKDAEKINAIYIPIWLDLLFKKLDLIDY